MRLQNKHFEITHTHNKIENLLKTQQKKGVGGNLKRNILFINRFFSLKNTHTHTQRQKEID